MTAYLLIWLLGLVVFVVGLALVVHAVSVRWVSTTLRFVYYLPGALAGASSVLLWLFVLDPTASPVSGLLGAMGFDSFVQVIQPGNLPAIFAIIAFWTGAGGWIIIMYGALNNISTDVIEAARIDGANAVQIAFRIQLPMLRKWVAYMGVMSLAAAPSCSSSHSCSARPATQWCPMTTRSTSWPTSTRSSRTTSTVRPRSR